MDEITISRLNSYMEAPARTAGRPAESEDAAATGEFTSTSTTRLMRRPPPQAAGRQEKRNALPSPEMRAALRAQWNAARITAAALVRAATAEDRMDIALAADKLDATLAKLWELRAGRDANWRAILNHAQGMLRQLFAQKRVEELTLEQCKSMQTLVEQCLGPATKSADDLNEAIRLIGDTGFDPYAAISGEPSGEQDETQPSGKRP